MTGAKKELSSKEKELRSPLPVEVLVGAMAGTVHAHPTRKSRKAKVKRIDKMSKKTLEHGMLLDAKRVMDNAIPDLQDLYEMVPAKLHLQLLGFIEQFKSTLAECDVSERYEEK